MDNANNGKGKMAAYVVAILATFLLMAFLVKQMVKVTQTPPANAARAAERAAENAKIRAEGAEAAKNWGYVDPAKGIVRVPIEQAMKDTLKEYQTPATFHTNLMKRLDKAFPPPVNYE